MPACFHVRVRVRVRVRLAPCRVVSLMRAVRATPVHAMRLGRCRLALGLRGGIMELVWAVPAATPA
eukprot:7397707-Lingulodinium_polyedra.AAC.1